MSLNDVGSKTGCGINVMEELCMPLLSGIFSLTVTVAEKFLIKKESVLPSKPSLGLPINPTRAEQVWLVVLGNKNDFSSSASEYSARTAL
jgi:hypothetical protein